MEADCESLIWLRQWVHFWRSVIGRYYSIIRLTLWLKIIFFASIHFHERSHSDNSNKILHPSHPISNLNDGKKWHPLSYFYEATPILVTTDKREILGGRQLLWTERVNADKIGEIFLYTPTNLSELFFYLIANPRVRSSANLQSFRTCYSYFITR